MKNNWHSDFVFVSPKKKSVQLPALLSNDFGRDFLGKYYEVVSEKYGNHEQLMKVNLYRNEICNQNLYSSIVTEEILNEIGLRSASFSDFSTKEFLSNPILKQGCYDLGVVFRGVGYPKANVSKEIERQLEEMNFLEKNLSNFPHSMLPIVISLSGLELDFNSDYKFGIGVKIKEGATPYCSSSLADENANRVFCSFNSAGPMFNKRGHIVLRSTDSGLSRIIFKNNCVLDSSNGQFSLATASNKTIVLKK